MTDAQTALEVRVTRLEEEVAKLKKLAAQQDNTTRDLGKAVKAAQPKPPIRRR